jgi:hypothetical protein
MDTLLQASAVNIDGVSSSPFNMALHGGPAAAENSTSPLSPQTVPFEETEEEEENPESAGYMIMAPLRMIKRLARVVAQSAGPAVNRGEGSSTATTRPPVEARVEARMFKRRKTLHDNGDDSSHHQARSKSQLEPSRTGGEFWRTYPDLVALGFIPEHQARLFFDQYFATSHILVPVYDKSFDTWESLRIRSPFSISTILSVAARANDGGGPMSEHQRHCLEHARKVSLGTIYHPINRVEAVQAMLLLATFNDDGWLIGGHACRMAMDMGLDQAFRKLQKTGMGRNKVGKELEADRLLVIGARTYFALYLFEHQMSYGNGRQTILREDDTIHRCRSFLDHPLTNICDISLISSVELMALRSPLHTALTSSAGDPLDYRTIKDIQAATKTFEDWNIEWSPLFPPSEEGDFYRESLILQRSYSCLFINSQVLRNVSGPARIKRMSPDEKGLALRAIGNAQMCLSFFLEGEWVGL